MYLIELIEIIKNQRKQITELQNKNDKLKQKLFKYKMKRSFKKRYKHTFGVDWIQLKVSMIDYGCYTKKSKNEIIKDYYNGYKNRRNYERN